MGECKPYALWNGIFPAQAHFDTRTRSDEVTDFSCVAQAQASLKTPRIV